MYNLVWTRCIRVLKVVQRLQPEQTDCQAGVALLPNHTKMQTFESKWSQSLQKSDN